MTEVHRGAGVAVFIGAGGHHFANATPASWLIHPANQRVFHEYPQSNLAWRPFPVPSIGPQFPFHGISGGNVRTRAGKKARADLRELRDMRLACLFTAAQRGLNLCQLLVEGLVVFLCISESVIEGRQLFPGVTQITPLIQ